MTAYDYARAKATADRLIEKFGQLGAIRRTGAPTGPAYDPTPGATTDYPARFAMLDYKASEIDGTRILQSDRKVLLAPGTLSITPSTSDKVVAGSEVLSVVDVEFLSPAGTVVLYTLQCRR